MTPSGRFDDLRSGTALAFDADTVVDVLVAHAHHEVPAVLAAVDDAVTSGRWAFGMLAYEAGAEHAEMLLAARVLVQADLVRAAELAVVSSLRGWRAARLAPDTARALFDAGLASAPA